GTIWQIAELNLQLARIEEAYRYLFGEDEVVPRDDRGRRSAAAASLTERRAPAPGQTAARRAHAHEFAAATSSGYDTLVGERGIRLSTGQRQRIAIARAFLDAKPILVLDEATSALDSESEVLVQRSLEDLWHDRTVVAVAHRLSTLRQMDRIVVLDGGRIVEQGPHHDLVAAGGHYSRLWKHQSGGMIATG
nr:ATP-binding cassette domain-containing protein [Micromonospora sp. DSM 115978]